MVVVTSLTSIILELNSRKAELPANVRVEVLDEQHTTHVQQQLSTAHVLLGQPNLVQEHMHVSAHAHAGTRTHAPTRLPWPVPCVLLALADAVCAVRWLCAAADAAVVSWLWGWSGCSSSLRASTRRWASSTSAR